jgi:riboflavin synthase
MFTGLIQAVGTVEALLPQDGGIQMSVSIPAEWASRLQLGDSVAIDGCCTTVIALEGATFRFQASPETLRCTRMGSYQVGDRLNLECPLTPTTPMGGHYVSGHVDCVGHVTSRTEEGLSWLITVALPPSDPSWMRLVIAKGSVALNGISLTVNTINDETNSLSLAIIPHTWEQTNIAGWQVGTPINIELDLLGKTVERLLAFK